MHRSRMAHRWVFSAPWAGNQREIMEKKVAAGAAKIKADVAAKYQLLSQAGEDYEQAAQEYELTERQAEAAGLRQGLGMISANQYEEQRAGLAQKQAALRQAGLSLRQALEDYRWAVNGLAQAE